MMEDLGLIVHDGRSWTVCSCWKILNRMFMMEDVGPNVHDGRSWTKCS